MPRGLNGTHRELSLAGTVVLVIWRPPALQAREDPNTNGKYGSVHISVRPGRPDRYVFLWSPPVSTSARLLRLPPSHAPRSLKPPPLLMRSAH